MLSPQAKAILELLVSLIRQGRIIPGDAQSFLGYKEAHELLNIERIVFHWGKSLRKQGLEELANWLIREKLPAITGIIVDQNNFLPGEMFFEVYGQTPGNREWWAEEVRRAIAFDWSAYVPDDHPPTYEELVDFTLAITEGEITKVSREVRTRCEALRNRARQYYRGDDGKLRCEICGWVKPHNMITGDIVELHHIRPISELPRDGVRLTFQQAIESLAPLCPTCHRIAHSRLGERRAFTMDELKKIVPKYESAPTGNVLGTKP